jgi:uroporphyrin-3 C-methyltransferase
MPDAENKTAVTKKSVKSDTPVKKAASTTKPIKEKTPTYTGVYTMVFFLALACSGGFYYFWLQQQQILIQQKRFIDTIEQKVDLKVDGINQQQIEFSKKTAEQIEAFHSKQEYLRQNLTELIQNNKQLRKDWLLAEAEYLIQLASYRLLLEKDVSTALVALKAADSRLAEIADPALLKIRGIIANDIQTLANIQTVDLAGLSVTISALSNNISKLPLNTPNPEKIKLITEEMKSDSLEVKNLKDLPAAIWRDIKSLIVIRNHQKPIQPLLTASQHFFLMQNLALLFEQSRLALLNGQNEIYQERLETTKTWINKYFDTEHNITRNMLASIDDLKKYNIAPTLPDISSTFSTLKEYRLHGEQPQAAKVKVTP